MARNDNQGTFNIYSLMRRAVREEIERIFTSASENTSQADPSEMSTGAYKTGPKRVRRRVSAPGHAKGRVIDPSKDRRLKANREL